MVFGSRDICHVIRHVAKDADMPSFGRPLSDYLDANGPCIMSVRALVPRTPICRRYGRGVSKARIYTMVRGGTVGKV